MAPTNPGETIPSFDVATKPKPHDWKGYSPAFDRALWTGLKIQLVMAIVTAGILDFGVIHRAFLVAMLCQLATVVIILVRRPMAPTRFDLAIVAYGIIPLFLIVANFGPMLLRFLGIPNG